MADQILTFDLENLSEGKQGVSLYNSYLKYSDNGNAQTQIATVPKLAEEEDTKFIRENLREPCQSNEQTYYVQHEIYDVAHCYDFVIFHGRQGSATNYEVTNSDALVLKAYNVKTKKWSSARATATANFFPVNYDPDNYFIAKPFWVTASPNKKIIILCGGKLIALSVTNDQIDWNNPEEVYIKGEIDYINENISSYVPFTGNIVSSNSIGNVTARNYSTFTEFLSKMANAWNDLYDNKAGSESIIYTQSLANEFERITRGFDLLQVRSNNISNSDINSISSVWYGNRWYGLWWSMPDTNADRYPPKQLVGFNGLGVTAQGSVLIRLLRNYLFQLNQTYVETSRWRTADKIVINAPFRINDLITEDWINNLADTVYDVFRYPQADGWQDVIGTGGSIRFFQYQQTAFNNVIPDYLNAKDFINPAAKDPDSFHDDDARLYCEWMHRWGQERANNSPFVSYDPFYKIRVFNEEGLWFPALWGPKAGRNGINCSQTALNEALRGGFVDNLNWNNVTAIVGANAFNTAMNCYWANELYTLLRDWTDENGIEHFKRLSYWQTLSTTAIQAFQDLCATTSDKMNDYFRAHEKYLADLNDLEAIIRSKNLELNALEVIIDKINWLRIEVAKVRVNLNNVADLAEEGSQINFDTFVLSSPN